MLSINYGGIKLEINDEQKAKAIWEGILETTSQHKTEPKAEPKNNRKPHKRFILGARRWTVEEYDKCVARYIELERTTGETKRKIFQKLAQEFNRTPSAISVVVWRYEHNQPTLRRKEVA